VFELSKGAMQVQREIPALKIAARAAKKSRTIHFTLLSAACHDIQLEILNLCLRLHSFILAFIPSQTPRTSTARLAKAPPLSKSPRLARLVISLQPSLTPFRLSMWRLAFSLIDASLACLKEAQGLSCSYLSPPRGNQYIATSVCIA
jgi:hypothetical protein